MTTPTPRHRWKMHHRCQRLLVQVRAGRAKVITFGEEALERAAREWAGPFAASFFAQTVRGTPVGKHPTTTALLQP